MFTHTLIIVILPDPKKCFVFTGTSLYRGSLYRGSAVLLNLAPPSHACAHFTNNRKERDWSVIRCSLLPYLGMGVISAIFQIHCPNVLVTNLALIKSRLLLVNHRKTVFNDSHRNFVNPRGLVCGQKVDNIFDFSTFCSFKKKRYFLTCAQGFVADGLANRGEQAREQTNSLATVLSSLVSDLLLQLISWECTIVLPSKYNESFWICQIMFSPYYTLKVL